MRSKDCRTLPHALPSNQFFVEKRKGEYPNSDDRNTPTCSSHPSLYSRHSPGDNIYLLHFTDSTRPRWITVKDRRLHHSHQRNRIINWTEKVGNSYETLNYAKEFGVNGLRVGYRSTVNGGVLHTVSNDSSRVTRNSRCPLTLPKVSQQRNHYYAFQGNKG